MAKAPSLQKDRNKGTQRTRKLCTVHAPCMLGTCAGTLRGFWPGRRPEGVAPWAVKAARTVLNGGDEETYRKVTRLVPTQPGYPPRLTPGVRLPTECLNKS